MKTDHYTRHAVIWLLCACAAAAPAAAQNAPPTPLPPAPPFTLEILTRQGDFYWVVRTDPTGARVGGWMSAATIESALRPIPPADAPVSPSATALPAAVSAPQPERPEASAQPQPTPQPQTPALLPKFEPLPQTARGDVRRPQTREGFWFSGGMGLGSLGCKACGGRANGLSGGISLGGTINEKWLIGGGTTG